MTKRKIQYWVIPPEGDTEFIAAMEEILDTYEEPYDADRPVLCMDEQPVQLHKETRKPISATKKHARRIDYEYERCCKRRRRSAARIGLNVQRSGLKRSIVIRVGVA